ncbi:myotubularin-related protein 6 [Cylas formicarius]|uniref:myotubularin-related protein 6 n=1 Tax=Cylas formicarius TaxID=197179 RepID=UPI0029586393|nr:myotubularin-related protein 6 [Cylas formicarius]
MELIRTPKVESVRMLDRYSKACSQGTLYLTATHLIFVDPEAKRETWILHMHMASLEKLPLTTTGSPLLIRTKTFLSVTFVIPKERDCHDIYLSLNQLSQLTNYEALYCFTYNSPIDDIPKRIGWKFFDLQGAYQRMGVPNEQWALTDLNMEYELCDTYPKHLYIPASATKSTLLGSSRFRSKGRLPVLAYLYHNKASISRCSQPLSGFSARCMEDEKMLNNILRTNPNATFMYVVDTRPKINAMANRAAGKGYENEAFYENIKFHFLGVENIHVMRNSLLKVIENGEQKNPTMNSFLNGIESSGWLRHIKSILDASQFIAEALEEGISVIVHCSDGWDRTAQVCSLASMLLDPYYRTISGYQALIEKDWLAFGHKFSERCGHIQTDSKEISPVFTQLLDATWQLMQQFPCTFQFNENFLLTIHDHVHSCQYGTFIGNCEKDRLDLRLSERTYSLWGYMANHLDEYINPLYSSEESPGIITPQLIPQNIRFWRGMYYRFESGVHPREPTADLLLATSDHSFSLDDHVKYLTKRITSVKNLISKTMEKRKTKPKKSQFCNNVQLDNKLLYEKSSHDLESANHDHPLQVEEKDSSNAQELPKIDELSKDFDSVAIDWKALRNINECSCSLSFDHLSKKNHCRKCGEIFCVRCITKQVLLPGHTTEKAVPVCKPCYDLLGSSLES